MPHHYPRSVVIGKFYPPHAGHHHLIDTALRNSDHVDVLVVDNPGEKIPAEHRRDWLAAVHPDANVRVIPDIGKDDDSIAWAAHTTKFLHYVPDAVFTSETYGDTWAYHMVLPIFPWTTIEIATPYPAPKFGPTSLETGNTSLIQCAPGLPPAS